MTYVNLEEDEHEPGCGCWECVTDPRDEPSPYGDHECEYYPDMDGASRCMAAGHPCENGFDIGPEYDPYGVSCELTDDEHKKQLDGTARPAGAWVHRGVNPLPGPGPEPQWIEWEGGGYAAGDPLPIRNRRALANDGTEMK